MLDRLGPCVEARFALLILGFLYWCCLLVDRALYWAIRRTRGRLQRFFIGLEFRWFIRPWFPLQELSRKWENKIQSELDQIQME